MTAAPPSLPARLQAHADRRPEQPWLLFRSGWDWRWRSWGAVATAVRDLAAEVRQTGAAAGLAPPARIGFPYRPGPDGVALDLALQAAGFAAAPLPAGPGAVELAGALERRGCRGLAILAAAAGEVGEAGDLAGGDDGPEAPARAAAAAGLPLLTLPSPGLAARTRPRVAEPAEASSLDLEAGAGPVVVGVGGGGGGGGDGREVAQAELLAAAEGLAAALAPRRRRDVVVSAHPLEAPAGRLLLAWSLVAGDSGAALVLEPEPGRLVATAVWARPTVFVGAAPERRALRDWLAAHDRPHTRIRRRPRPPLRRLHTVLATDAVAADERAFWASRGVGTLPIAGVV